MGPSAPAANSFQLNCSRSYTELAAWVLLLLRYLPTSMLAAGSENNYFQRVVRVLFHMQDAVAQCRFFAELATLLLQRDLADDPSTPLAEAAAGSKVGTGGRDSGVRGAGGLLSQLLDSPLMQSTSSGAVGAVSVGQNVASMSRFVAALCNGLAVHVLPTTLATFRAVRDIFESVQSEARNVSAAGATPAAAVATPYLLDMDFVATSDATADNQLSLAKNILQRLQSGAVASMHTWQLLETSPLLLKMHEILSDAVDAASLVLEPSDPKNVVKTKAQTESALRVLESACDVMMTLLLQAIQSGVMVLRKFERYSYIMQRL